MEFIELLNYASYDTILQVAVITVPCLASLVLPSLLRWCDVIGNVCTPSQRSFMACGIALKRSLDLDSPYGPEHAVKRRCTGATSPRCLSFHASPTHSPPAVVAEESPRKLSLTEIEVYLRQELRGNTNRINDMDTDQKVDVSTEIATFRDRPLLSIRQLCNLCDRLLKEQEIRLREEFEEVLNARLTEQYQTFVRFTYDQIHRRIDSTEPSFVLKGNLKREFTLQSSRRPPATLALMIGSTLTLLLMMLFRLDVSESIHPRSQFSGVGTMSVYSLRLPAFEVVSSFVIWFAHVAYAWYLIGIESALYGSEEINQFNFVDGWSIIGRIRDNTNFEWNVWMDMLPYYVLALVLHRLLSYLLERFDFGVQKALFISSLLWPALNCIAYGWFPVAVSLVYGFTLFITTRITTSLVALWAICLVFFGSLFSDIYNQFEQPNYYIFCVYITYKLLQCISYFSYQIESAKVGGFKKPLLITLRDGCLYAFYMPYSTVLFVTYRNFIAQCVKRSDENSRRAIVWLGLRVVFWTLFCEFVLHIFYMNSMILDVEFLKHTRLDVLCALVLTAGQFFHAKYVAIFGFFALFAKLDGMDPHWKPVCIARVALYSVMWRCFDHGLYTFLRDHIFKPIANSTLIPLNQSMKQFLAIAVTFVFVWIFHGQSETLGWWALLNLLEIFLETVAAMFDRRWDIFSMLVTVVGPFNTRRLIGIAMIPCTALSVFSIVYFLSNVECANVVIERLAFNRYQWTVQPALIYLIGLGYFFVQFCIEMQQLAPVEMYMDTPRRRLREALKVFH
ncbi:Protein-cysteine N-palmitoyltransferase Rasp [Trichinella zimbabwensis]|uniref:Protein-cysteine N-palmitoyltransferase Rasp n=1 Tax=Trichinella zimbabwensis TaxID=268475 RepID=A0A0V1HXR0_9BILA|nr:Protein-cysteine N-palmitoyltransferase Rasp [Trichinella zimbabwensis]